MNCGYKGDVSFTKISIFLMFVSFISNGCQFHDNEKVLKKIESLEQAIKETRRVK